jgi:hypothetical protein
MSKFSKTAAAPGTTQHTPRASLAALGLKVIQLQLFAPVREQVHIAQKVVKHTPSQKLCDGFLAILAGAHGLVEINTRVRGDRALCRAWGRQGAAEQSVVQDTLDACTLENLAQMEAAMNAIYQRFGRGYRHDYAAEFQVLDVDLSGKPCGRKAELATKGYFSRSRNRRGHQVGRVLDARTGEIVVDRLFAGNQQLVAGLRPLMLAAEAALGLEGGDPESGEGASAEVLARRARTVVRVDSGGGTVEDVNWLLRRGYQVHLKDYSGPRVRRLAASVTRWQDDPRTERQMGWVGEPATDYVREVRRIAVRCRKKNGQWAFGVLLSTLTPAEALARTGQSAQTVTQTVTQTAAQTVADAAVLLAYVRFYDQRGGSIELSYKEDKQGLGLAKRNKKRFAAQAMLVQLSALAHNVLLWARSWLAVQCPRLARLGLLRFVRDVLGVSGQVVCGPEELVQSVQSIVLNPGHPLARDLVRGLAALLAPQHVAVILGEI